VPDSDDPEAKYVKNIDKGMKMKSTCGKLMKKKKKYIKNYCRDKKYGQQGAAIVCPVNCSIYIKTNSCSSTLNAVLFRI